MSYNRTYLNAYFLLRFGGEWLGAARKWLQRKRCVGNGQTIIWGSHEEVRPPLTAGDVDEIAAESAAAALNTFANKYVSALMALANIPIEELGLTMTTQYITADVIKLARRALFELGFDEKCEQDEDEEVKP